MKSIDNSKVEWWQKFLTRIRFPDHGHFMIVPDDEPGAVLLMHGETMQRINMTLDEGESMEDCAELFRHVLPCGKVASPS